MEITFKATISESSITLRPMEPFESGHGFTFPNRATDNETLIENFYAYAVELLRLRVNRLGEIAGS